MSENFRIESAAVTDRGLNERRVTNEDSYLEMPEYGIFAVADGVGGAQAGETASEMAVEIVGEAFANLRPEDDAEEIMKQAIKRANTAVYQMSQELQQLSGMATTIVALHIKENIATIGHVGDSRLYRLDPRGNLFRETQDHSIVEEEVRAGRMTPAQAARHPSRNVISRAVGAEKDVEIDLKTIMIEPKTTFLLCSDGVTRHIEDYELREILLGNPDPRRACEKIKEICYQRGAEDNLTAVVVKVGASAEFEEVFSETETSEGLAAKISFASSDAMTRDAEQEAFGAQLFDGEGEKIVEQKAEVKKVGFFRRLLRNVFLITLGGILGIFLCIALGAILHHFGLLKLAFPQLEKENIQPIFPLPVEQSPNIEYTAFESSRRNVDKDPERYIQQYVQLGEGKAETAEDFYLLGRAYLLTGQYSEAEKAFEQAREKLNETKDVNRKTLEVEIAAGLSIVRHESARQEFIKQRSQKESKSTEETKQASNVAEISSNKAETSSNKQIRIGINVSTIENR